LPAAPLSFVCRLLAGQGPCPCILPAGTTRQGNMHRAPKKKILEFWQPKAPVPASCLQVLPGKASCTGIFFFCCCCCCSGYWAHGQVLDALCGCSSRSYLHGHVTASLEERELWGGCHNRLPHPLDGSFYGVNSLLLGPAHVTNLLQKKKKKKNHAQGTEEK
jgi:hypothetical protein